MSISHRIIKFLRELKDDVLSAEDDTGYRQGYLDALEEVIEWVQDDMWDHAEDDEADE